MEDLLKLLIFFAIVGGLIYLLGSIDAMKAKAALARWPLEPCFRCGPDKAHLQRKTKDDWFVRCYSCGTQTEPAIFASAAISTWNKINAALKNAGNDSQPH
ncbi:hypothetical protein [Rhizobium multihospitium]|uniref:Uncharacterized protein n=1 Tax=Rhizobium multihospitium TaxID=410764 RepID=A0A1C3WS54_9HYPH|nr:hypothetical protein [Rhizobium multihospitium]SCB42801.1 hypothetical protein GA0061103_6139 [Rhizobium multihospitium]